MRWLLILTLVLFAACIPDLEDKECYGNDECPGGICTEEGVCQAIDAGSDAGIDAGTDAGTDAG